MKARHVLWPVMILGAVTIASACSSGGATGTGGGIVGGADAGGADGTGDTGSGATSSTGATDAGGGMSNTGDSGASTGGMSSNVGGEASGVGGAGGAAVNLCEGLDLNCEDDGDPCTEDECNPATGTCGIPRDDTECDDGLFCNGLDTCEAGACTGHAGTTCEGVCNEGGDYCECAGKQDCPADEVGEFSACEYANECVETGSRSRVVTKYTCNGVGKCVGAPTVENDNCPRDTDGTVCTDDALPCNGSEKCKAGNCVGDNVNPCAADPDPYCYNTGDTCRMCQSGGTAANPAPGCTDANYHCCFGTSCVASSLCKIATTLPPIVGQIVITGLQ